MSEFLTEEQAQINLAIETYPEIWKKAIDLTDDDYYLTTAPHNITNDSYWRMVRENFLRNGGCYIFEVDLF